MNNSLYIITALHQGGLCYLACSEDKTEFKDLSEFDRIIGTPLLNLMGVPLSGYTAHLVTEAYNDVVHEGGYHPEAQPMNANSKLFNGEG